MTDPVLLHPEANFNVPDTFSSVDEVLECAKRMGANNILVLCETADGKLTTFNSDLTFAEANWLLDRAKALLLASIIPERRGSA